VPTFRVRTRDGQERSLQALRIRSDVTRVYLENRTAGHWDPVEVFPLSAIETVQRRLDEPDGRCTWITERIRPMVPVPSHPSA